ncbi:hypothetical protein LSTR_LSTR012051 [Laodelphax striatellus]|uniref:Gamma-tubulin complex component n=1 Tax=Laodelphax striatellus TaxID=195883 RepID=A0A482WQG6_LAOST|nr:hypothetical protein LSTR_LSTR012051 [Laodelphax striatellus]
MLHEIILALHGCISKVLHTEGYAVELGKVLHPSEKELLKRIIQIGGTYKKIESFIKKYASPTFEVDIINDIDSNGRILNGLYLQAFCFGLQTVLTPYSEKVVELEKDALKDPHLSLSSIHTQVDCYSQLLAMLSNMIDEIRENDIHGCKLMKYTCRHLSTGVESLRNSLIQITVSLHAILVNQLTDWLLYGKIIDPYEEFFIKAKPAPIVDNDTTLRSERTTATVAESEGFGSTQTAKPSLEYYLDEDFLPPFISFSTAHKIFYIGKTVQLFTSNPYDDSEFKKNSIFEKEEVELVKSLQECSFQDTLSSDSTISKLESSVTQKLWSLAMNEAGLMGQLKAIKDFYLLGRGELFVDFLSNVGHLLLNAPSSLTVRELNVALVNSARSVQLNDEAILEKFNFSIPPKDSCPPEVKIKQVLSLSYEASWPLHLFFSPIVVQNYNILFRYFLRVKQVQLNLHSVWITDVKIKEKRLTDRSWQLRKDLMFLVENLQCYLQWDVVESEYSALVIVLQKSQDFEMIRQAHHKFLYNILIQSFLMPVEAKCDTSTGLLLPSSAKGRRHSVNVCLNQILDLSEAFCQLISQSEYNVEELEGMAEKLNHCINILMKLISNLRNQISGMHLSKLLLRLDYNHYFSQIVQNNQS